jgi:hypothetical protein
VRLGMPGFLVSKVSQKVAAPPNFKPQFPATGPGVVGDDGDPDPEPDPDPDPDSDAVHVALAPPLEPPQLHVHGPDPATVDAVPAEQRLAEGLDDTVVPFADPHTPLTGAALAPTATVVLAAGDVPPVPEHVRV